jgi:hypothetical protein
LHQTAVGENGGGGEITRAGAGKEDGEACNLHRLRRDRAGRGGGGGGSMSRSGNVWDNADGDFFSSLKTDRIDRKTYRTMDEAKADMFELHSNASTTRNASTRQSDI